MKIINFIRKHAKALMAGGTALLLAGCVTTSQTVYENELNYILSLQRDGFITSDECTRQMQILREDYVSGRITATTTFNHNRFKKNTAPAPQPAAPAVQAPVATAKAAPAGRVWDYQPKSIISGRLRSIGSDTMDKIMDRWQADFLQIHKSLRFMHEGKGSSTAVPALMERRAEIGPMSRSLKDKEISLFQQKFGYTPLQLRTAVDCIAVYVHPDNPFAKKGLSMKQLDAIFSSQRLRGGAPVKTWGDLGLSGEWAQAPVKVYSRNSASGTHSFFKKSVLKKAAYRADAVMFPGSEQLVTGIANDKFAIGYSGIGYKTDAVAVVPLSTDANQFYPPEAMYAYTGQYPLARFLYLTINRNPAKAPGPLQYEFMKYVYSKDGQGEVEKEGFFALSSKVIAEEMEKLTAIK